MTSSLGIAPLLKPKEELNGKWLERDPQVILHVFVARMQCLLENKTLKNALFVSFFYIGTIFFHFCIKCY